MPEKRCSIALNKFINLLLCGAPNVYVITNVSHVGFCTFAIDYLLDYQVSVDFVEKS